MEIGQKVMAFLKSVAGAVFGGGGAGAACSIVAPNADTDV